MFKSRLFQWKNTSFKWPALKHVCLFSIFMCLSANKAEGQQRPPTNEHLGDVFNSEKFLLGKGVIRGDMGYFYNNIAFQDASGELFNYHRHAIRTNVNFVLWRQLEWRNTLFFDLAPSPTSPPWISNYFYQLGWYDWRPNTFSYGYENYLPNSWENMGESFLTNFRRGHLFLRFNTLLSKESTNIGKPFFWDESSRLSIVPGARFHFEYQGNFFNELGGYYKPIGELTLRYTIYKHIYIESTLFYYPIIEQRLIWEPDFTYGFGIANWRAFKLNLTYGNWIANRFPWSEQTMDFYGFANGEWYIGLTYSW